MVFLTGGAAVKFSLDGCLGLRLDSGAARVDAGFLAVKFSLDGVLFAILWLPCDVSKVLLVVAACDVVVPAVGFLIPVALNIYH